MTTATHYDWPAIEADRARQGVAKQQIAGHGGSLVRIEVRAGTVADPHSHPHEQFVQVISGKLRVEASGNHCELGPGSVLHLPPDTVHSAVFDEDTVLVEVNLGG